MDSYAEFYGSKRIGVDSVLAKSKFKNIVKKENSKRTLR